MPKDTVIIKTNTVLIIMAVILILFAIIMYAITDFTSTLPAYSPQHEAQPSCDKEAEAWTATSEAMSYCRSNPYGTFRTTVCGIPFTIECRGALVGK